MTLRTTVIGLGFVLLAGCSFQASCGAGKSLDMKKAEAFIETTLAHDLGVTPKVTCPAHVEIDQGARFECALEVEATKGTVVLEQKDAKGYVEIASVSGVLIAAKLESQVATSMGKQLNAHIEVDCGPRFRPAVAGDGFRCQARDAKGATAEVAIKVKDALGNVDFELITGGAAAAPDEPTAEPTATPDEPTAAP